MKQIVLLTVLILAEATFAQPEEKPPVKGLPCGLEVTLTNDSLEPGTLRQTINCANLAPGTDTITLPAGIYTLTIPGASEELNATGDLDVLDSLIITGETGNPEDVVIDASGLDLDGEGPGFGDRAIDLRSGSLTLQHLTIRGGNVEGKGGGIRSTDADLTLSNVFVTDNQTAFMVANFVDFFGGGVSISSSQGSPANLMVTDSIFSGNISDFGGAIHGERSLLQVRRTQIFENISGSFGGAIASSDESVEELFQGELSIEASVITDNTAETDGGGVYFSGDTLEVLDTTIENNLSKFSFGGGLVILGANQGSISRTTISKNHAPFAGGAFFTGGAFQIVNCTLSGNTADFGVGGIFNGGDLSIANSTIVDNTSIEDDSGIDTPDTEENPLIMHNTIVARNGDQDIMGSIDPISASNLIGNGTGMTGIGDGSNGNQIGTENNPIDPLLGPLADNGGPTQTHALLEGSPALDAGDNTRAIDGEGAPLSTDQRGEGFLRVVDGDENGTATVDIGAFELGVVAACPQPYPDFNEDMRVDAKDLLELLQGNREGNTDYDLTGDIVTNGRDLIEFGLSWYRPDCALEQ